MMTKTRQSDATSADYAAVAPQGRGTLAHGDRVEAHAHVDGQLVYAVSGVLFTVTEGGTWVAPANRISWTPPGFEHAYRFYGETDVCVLSVPRDLCGPLPPRPSVFAASPLLREALLALTNRAQMQASAYERLRGVILDELVDAPDQPLHLPEPRDDRLRAVTEFVRANLSHPSTLAELGRAAGASERTLSRLFHDELGMTFHRWRTLLRIHHALVKLGEGMSVTDTATACGWANTTSFIDAFTASVGQTPGRYQGRLREHGDTPSVRLAP